MANYATLKAAIVAAIRENGNKEITGNLLQQQLLAMVNSLGVGYQYAGIATPETDPGTPDQNVFYLASTAGTYTNFGNIVLADGEIAILKYNGTWAKDSTGAASLERVNQLDQETNGKIESSVLLAGTRFQPTEIVGYIAETGIINPLPQFHSLITSKIPVQEGDAFAFIGNGNAAAPNAFLYNGDSLVSTQITTGGNLNVTIPNGITHIVFASFADSGDVIYFQLHQTNPISLQEQIEDVEQDVDIKIENLQPKREISSFEELTPVVSEGAGLYDCLTGNIDFPTSDEFCYNKYDVENMSVIKVKGRGYTYVNGYSLVTFTDSNNNILGYLHQDVNETIINVPAGCKYAYVNGGVQDAYKPSAYNQIISYSDLIPEIDSLNKKVNSLIICTGDSVTEGMNMDGGGYAEYGKAPYPAQLYTMLVDNGYDFEVVNQGQGGETAPTMVARTGGMACRTHHDVNLPQDTSWVDFGNTITAESCNMQIPVKKLDGVTDFGVYFTVLKPVTQPLFIDGNLYDCNVISQNSNFYLQIRKQSADNKATKIPAGTIVLTHSSKSPYLNIVFGGYNGRRELNFEKWSTMMESCLTTSANKGFIIGCHIAIWEEWADITGSTADEKYADYRKKCYDKFGFRFIDLYDLWFRHALDYCLDAGYFSDKTQAELDAIAAKLEQHIVPAEFSYDGQHEGNVHLNREGYYVIAKLIFDRLKAIHYI